MLGRSSELLDEKLGCPTPDDVWIDLESILPIDFLHLTRMSANLFRPRLTSGSRGRLAGIPTALRSAT